MNKIDANAETLKTILSEKYSVDYFQREYSWKQEHIQALVSDLTSAFLQSYTIGDERAKVEHYNTYYLGSLLVTAKDAKKSIIDGQQRLTSVTLILIFLKNQLEEYSLERSVVLEDRIYSEKFGKKSFNIQVEEREECFGYLFENKKYSFNPNENNESIQNMLQRYEDIANSFPYDEISENNILHFIDWIIEKVIMTVITTTSDEESYKIFETMNDRGLNLTSAEMLKAFLLANIDDIAKREQLNKWWQNFMAELHEYAKDEEVYFFQAWLRGQYAQTIRESKKQATNEDFEKIGTRFHGWVKDNLQKVGIEVNSPNSFQNFIEREMKFYAEIYLKINEAQNTFNSNLESVYYIDDYGIAKSLSYPLMIAPINITDSKEIIENKINLVAKYIEIFVVRKSANHCRYYFDSIRYSFYNLVKEIRNKDLDELKFILQQRLDKMEEQLEGLRYFELNSQNKQFAKFFLSRISSFLEIESGDNKPYDYFYRSDDAKIKSFEIEHIWANKYSRHKNEFESKEEFERYRNKIGDLILLPRGSNQSYGEKDYREKSNHYLKENILAKSLNPLSYSNNPNFLNMAKKFGFSFKPYEDFSKESIDERVDLYIAISKEIWKL